VHGRTAVATYLFTDIEGSTRLWEQDPVRMPRAMARHDAIARAAVEANRGVVVKMIGDGVHASFEDPLDALATTLELQRKLTDPAATNGIALRVRCGLHVGVAESRDNDFFGPAVNRAARVMSVAHGGQVLLSEAVAVLVRGRLPPGVSLRALGAVRLRDLSTVENVYQVVHADLREGFPALRSLEATPNNLPRQGTTFIGREIEINDAKRALGSASLVTLFGAGGIGKTRLSLQLAVEVLDDYSDGAWFVELAPLNDERLVAQAVASVLGVKEEVGHPVTEALVKHLADRHLLLILDNCEHLVRACAALAEQLIRSAPHLRILASSREPLRVSGEVCFPVPALEVPNLQDSFMPGALSQYPSVRLFVSRAAAARSTFSLTDDNAVAVAEICQRLDGIPLAIELAAARVRAMSAENIATRLNDRFSLLNRGDRTALPRQQTLRALIDWSYDILTAREKTLFCRLAVFAGGWTLESAEAVCSGDDVHENGMLDLLSDLIDKSLVTVVAEGERYRLLETVRQYADDRLTQSGEGDATRSRHLEFFLNLTEKVAPQLLGADQGTGLQRIDVERENILSAHGWALRVDGGAELDYRLVHAIKHYWFSRGLLNLGHRVTVEATENKGGQSSSAARCNALFVAGQICCAMGRYAEAPRYLEEGLQTARALDDKRLVVSVLGALTWAALGQGDRPAARMHGQVALELAQQLGNKRQIAVASNALAQICRLEGDLASAQPLYEQSVHLGRELGDREMVAAALLNLAILAIQHGAVARARVLLGEVLSIAEETGSKPAGQGALEVSAGLAAIAEDWEYAARFYGLSERQTDDTGIQRDPADDAFHRPMIAKTRAALGDARFTDAYTSGGMLTFEEGIGEARAWLSKSA
jgi:predicted ATPase/class 3 adenylate cyclase